MSGERKNWLVLTRPALDGFNPTGDSKVIPRFSSEISGLTLLFAVLVDASEGWRGVRMTTAIQERLEQMRSNPDSQWDDPDLGLVAA